MKPSKTAGKAKGGKNVKKQLKVKGGIASRYTTRNQALNRLQLKLADFRRLCILKGITSTRTLVSSPETRRLRSPSCPIGSADPPPAAGVTQSAPTADHPRPLPPRGPRRSSRASTRPTTTSRTSTSSRTSPSSRNSATSARTAQDQAPGRRGVPRRGPSGGEEAQVRPGPPRERYPTFLDALRDLDDPLTLAHLFAVLPADKRHGIGRVLPISQALARVSIVVTKMHALRKVFISVKDLLPGGGAQEITWLTPHAPRRRCPRTWTTGSSPFLDFYTSMLGFVNYKLYFDQGLGTAGPGHATRGRRGWDRRRDPRPRGQDGDGQGAGLRRRRQEEERAGEAHRGPGW